jgi:hypothetical protein
MEEEGDTICGFALLLLLLVLGILVGMRFWGWWDGWRMLRLCFAVVWARRKKKAIYVAVTEFDRTRFAPECDFTNER